MRNKIIYCLLIFVIVFIFAIGCSNSDEDNTTEENKEKYIKYVKKLNNVTSSSEDLPFDVSVDVDKLDDEEVRYQVIIDNAKEEITNVKALAIHNLQTDDVFPSIGIFDSTVSLLPNDSSSGIILVGYIAYEGDIDDFECEFKVLISYKIGETKYTSYYVTK